MIAFGRYFPAGFWIEHNVVVLDVTQPVVDAFLDAVGGFGGLESGVFLVFAATAPKDEPQGRADDGQQRHELAQDANHLVKTFLSAAEAAGRRWLTVCHELHETRSETEHCGDDQQEDERREHIQPVERRLWRGLELFGPLRLLALGAAHTANEQTKAASAESKASAGSAPLPFGGFFGHDGRQCYAFFCITHVPFLFWWIS
nr:MULTISPECIES: hypothetical protein [unclassified Providencia]